MLYEHFKFFKPLFQNYVKKIKTFFLKPNFKINFLFKSCVEIYFIPYYDFLLIISISIQFVSHVKIFI